MPPCSSTSALTMARPQTGTLGLFGGFGLDERLGNSIENLGWNTDAVIGDLDDQITILQNARVRGDRTTGFGELDGIGKAD